MIFGIAVVVVVVVVVIIVTYYEYKRSKNWPTRWKNHAVCYGTIRWRSAFIRTEGVRVRRHGPPSSSEGVAGGRLVTTSDTTTTTGTYEIVTTTDGDGYLVVENPSNNRIYLIMDPVILRIDDPRKIDLWLPGPEEVDVPTPFVAKGIVSTHQRLNTTYQILRTAEGQSYELMGPLANDILGARHIEARGKTSDDAPPKLELISYSILGPSGGDDRPFVGELLKWA
jgi:hypothetical protein